MKDAYDCGQASRQRVLDTLKKLGPLGVTDLATATGTTVQAAHKRLRIMHAMKEIERSVKRPYRYSAAVETTQPAHVFRDQHRAALMAYAQSKAKKEAAVVYEAATQIIGKRTIHRCSAFLPCGPGYGGGQARTRLARGFSILSEI